MLLYEEILGLCFPFLRLTDLFLFKEYDHYCPLGTVNITVAHRTCFLCIFKGKWQFILKNISHLFICVSDEAQVFKLVRRYDYLHSLSPPLSPLSQ